VADGAWFRFSADQVSRHFDPFSPAGRDRGAGLGLAISKTIVEEIGGRIEAENRPTGGALFRIRLPAMGDTRIINVVSR